MLPSGVKKHIDHKYITFGLKAMKNLGESFLLPCEARSLCAVPTSETHGLAITEEMYLSKQVLMYNNLRAEVKKTPL